MFAQFSGVFVDPLTTLPGRMSANWVRCRSMFGHSLVMGDESRSTIESGMQLDAPSHQELLDDLSRVRRNGVGKLRSTKTPALRRVAVILDLCDPEDTEPAPIVTVLRQAVGELGGGTDQEIAEYVLGLTPGAGLWRVGRRLETAAELADVNVETFRKDRLKDTLSYLAELVLEQCHTAHLRRARAEMAARRHPADSRLAVQWVERFEAYYRVWTPAYALAADLEAALEVYTHEPADHLPWDAESDEPYVPAMEARGYARSALYWYTRFLLEVKRFVTTKGGLWLASSTETEEAISDAVYRIGWHNDFNEDDDSWLRRHLADSRREEIDHFTDLILAFPRGVRLHEHWQRLVHKGVGVPEDERDGSQVWLTIRACHDYTRLIDEDWLRIADWYRPNSTPNEA